MASNTFSLKIISANRVFFTGRCQSVIVPGYDGQKEVLAHHENMVIAVMKERCVSFQKGKRNGSML